MDYREAAKELLAKKIELKNAYVSLGDEITMLENEKFAIRKCVGDTAVAAGGGSKYEEYITNLIFISDNTSLFTPRMRLHAEAPRRPARA